MPGRAIDAVGAGTLASEYFVLVGDGVHGPMDSLPVREESQSDILSLSNLTSCSPAAEPH